MRKLFIALFFLLLLPACSLNKQAIIVAEDSIQIAKDEYERCKNGCEAYPDELKESIEASIARVEEDLNALKEESK